MRKLGSLAIVFAGLMVLAQVPARLWDVATALSAPQDIGTAAWGPLGVFILAVVLQAGFGIALVLYSRQLASRFLDDEPLDSAVGPMDVLRTAILVLGTTMIVYALLGLLTLLAAAGVELIPQSDAAMGEIGLGGGLAYWVANLTRPLLQFIIGVCLVLFVRQLSSRLWSFAVDRKDSPDQASQPDADTRQPTCSHCGEPYDPADYREGAVHRCSVCGQAIDGCA